MRRSHPTHQRLDEPLLLGHDPFQQKGGHVAEIKVMSAGAVKSVVSALGAEFERNAGNKLNLNFGTAGSLRERIKDGENADLVVLSESAIAELVKLGLVVADTVVDLGRTVTGVVVREGRRRSSRLP